MWMVSDKRVHGVYLTKYRAEYKLADLRDAHRKAGARLFGNMVNGYFGDGITHLRATEVPCEVTIDAVPRSDEPERKSAQRRIRDNDWRSKSWAWCDLKVRATCEYTSIEFVIPRQSYASESAFNTSADCARITKEAKKCWHAKLWRR